jgi:hypothetical protein
MSLWAGVGLGISPPPSRYSGFRPSSFDFDYHVYPGWAVQVSMALFDLGAGISID